MLFLEGKISLKSTEVDKVNELLLVGASVLNK